MRSIKAAVIAAGFVIVAMTPLTGFGQTPGLIYKPAATFNGFDGRTVLDPNLDGYVSAAGVTWATGSIDYGADRSELGLIPIPIITEEPDGDLTRGATGGFTDLVDTAPGAGRSVFVLLKTVAGTDYFIVRFRLGLNSTAAKGFSILLDTDSNFPEPSYTNETNPGFEREIVLETGKGVKVYYYNTTSGAIDSTVSFDYETYHQRSLAATTNNDNTDIFIDFFVPASVLGNTPVRFAAATTINSQSALTGGVSDVNGIVDSDYSNDPYAMFVAAVGSFPPTSISSLGSGGSFPPPVSLTPTVNSGVTTASTSISGTSQEASGSTIEVFKDGVSLGTTTVGADGTWTLSGVSGLTSGDVITAKATATGKSASSASSGITVTGVQTCYVEPPVIVSATNSGSIKIGLTWTWPDGVTPSTSDPDAATVRVYEQTNTSTFTLVGSATPMGTDGTLAYTHGKAGNLSGTFVATVEFQGCTSAYSNTVQFNNSNIVTTNETTAPTITTSPIYASTGDQTVSVTNNHGASVTLEIFVNGVSRGTSSSVASGASSSFTLTGLIEGDVITARAQGSGTNDKLSDYDQEIVLGSATVSDAPSITGTYTAGSGKTVSGTSSEPAGSTIYLYADGTLIGSTTVSIYGTWSVTGLSLTAGKVLTAKADASGEQISLASSSITVAASAPSAPSITGSYQVGNTSITGTGGDGSVIVYVDGAPVDTVTAVSGAWTATVAESDLYRGAVITTTNLKDGIESAASTGVTVTGVVSFSITATDDNAIPNQTAGTPFNIKVTAKDASNGSGNTVSTFTGKVVLASSSTSTAGTGETSAFSSGVLTPHSMTLTTAGSSKTITAVSTTDPLATGTATISTISPGAASALVYSAQPTSTTSGSTLSPAITVRIEDAYGNLTTSTSTLYVTIGSNAGSGSLSGTTSVAAVNGVATFNSLSIDKAGAGYTLIVSDASPADGATGLTDATSSSFTITVGSPAQLAFGQQPGSVQSGYLLNETGVTVRIEDANGNLTSSTATVYLSIGTDPATGTTLVGTTSKAAVAGVATFDDLWVNKQGAGYTLVASDAASPDGTTGLDDATSTSFTSSNPSITITGGAGFRMISSPVSGRILEDLLQPLWIQGMTGGDVTSGTPNVWRYDGQNWVTLTDISSATGYSVSAGEGILVYVFANTDNTGGDELPSGSVTLSVSGTLPSTSVESPTVRRGQADQAGQFGGGSSSAGNGWNFMGNPFNRAVTVNGLGMGAGAGSNPHFNSSAYVYDPASNTYKSSNGVGGTLGGDAVSPFQAFFVQATSGGGASGNLNIPVSALANTNSKTFYKTGAPVSQAVSGRLYDANTASLHFTVTGEGLQDDFVVTFHPEGEVGKDRFDAYKIAPMSFTDRILAVGYDEQDAYDIQNLPFDPTVGVRLPFDVAYLKALTDASTGQRGYREQVGRMRIEWKDRDLFSNGFSVHLYDRLTGEMIDLATEQSHDFVSVESAYPAMTGRGFYPVRDHRFEIIVGTLSTSTQEDAGLGLVPSDIRLAQNHPNPFNPTTQIRFSLPSAQDGVNLAIYDLLGRRVATLLDDASLSAGWQEVSVDASRWPSGTYIYRLETGAGVQSRMMSLLK